MKKSKFIPKKAKETIEAGSQTQPALPATKGNEQATSLPSGRVTDSVTVPERPRPNPRTGSVLGMTIEEARKHGYLPNRAPPRSQPAVPSQPSPQPQRNMIVVPADFPLPVQPAGDVEGGPHAVTDAGAFPQDGFPVGGCSVKQAIRLGLIKQ